MGAPADPADRIRISSSPLESAPGDASIPIEVVAAVFAVALFTGIYRSLSGSAPIGFGPNWEQVAVARSLVNQHAFANPFSQTPTGPTAFVAPIHPAMLAVIIAIMGDRPAAGLPAILLEVLIQGVAAVLLLWISRRVFSSWIPGAIAASAVIAASDPLPQWDNSLDWLMMELVVLAALACWRWGWTGIITGLAWLVSPALAPASVAVVFFLRGWRYTLRTCAIAALVVLPWLIRNFEALHAPVFVRDNYPLELSVSNNDEAAPTMDGSPENYRQRHPTLNPAVAAEIARVGEVRYFQDRQTEAATWMRAHPRRFAGLTLMRMRLWWWPGWFIGIVNLLGIGGLAMRFRTPLARAGIAAFVLYPMPYYLAQFHFRFEYPVFWLAALMAGYVCWQSYRRAFDSDASGEPPV